METEKKVYAKQECYCADSTGFFLTKRQASAASSVIILLLTLTFISGYFWGQKKAAEVFTHKVVNDSFSDQVNYSMYSLYGEPALEERDDENKEEGEDNNDEAYEKEADKTIGSIEKDSVIKQDDAKQAVSMPVIGLDNNKSKHYAQLVGFGSRKTAEQFVNKIQKKGYNVKVHIVTNKSKSASGKIITWYQIVTEDFNDKAQLVEKVEKIKLGERLTGIKFNTK